MTDVNPAAGRASQDDRLDPSPDTDPGVAELEADIERTREDLAETVDLLAAKLDVKSRVQGRVADAKESAAHNLRAARARATDDAGNPTPGALGVGVGVLAATFAVLVVALWRRNAHRQPRRRR